jgi:putative SOS response-associated peptidase YedK
LGIHLSVRSGRFIREGNPRPGSRRRQRIPGFQPGFIVCPADPADVVANDDARELVAMPWGLVPYYYYDMPFPQRIDR